MNKKLSSRLIALLAVFALLLLLVKISTYFVSYSASMVEWINIGMFCLIGIGYLIYAFTLDKPGIQILVFACGCFLIAMNFIQWEYGSPVGIACILIPAYFIKRFSKKEDLERLDASN
jgi:hypothetical protein